MNNTIVKLSIFFLTFIILLAGGIITQLGYIHWDGHSSNAHSLLQSIATVIAVFCGSAALYQYYSNNVKSSMFLFIGVGF